MLRRTKADGQSILTSVLSADLVLSDVKMVEVGLLLEHGAKGDTPCGWREETPLQLGRHLGSGQILNLLGGKSSHARVEIGSKVNSSWNQAWHCFAFPLTPPSSKSMEYICESDFAYFRRWIDPDVQEEIGWCSAGAHAFGRSTRTLFVTDRCSMISTRLSYLQD
jgi:hypothetical protein